jgi:hypothetical protein
LEAQPAEPANTDQYGQAHLDTVYNGNQPGSTERGYYVALNTDGDGTTVTSASWTMQVIVKWELGHWLITDVTPVNGG